MPPENPFRQFITPTTKPTYQEGKSVILRELKSMAPQSLHADEREQLNLAITADLRLALASDIEGPLHYQVDGYLPIETSCVEEKVLIRRATSLVLEFEDTERIIAGFSPHYRQAMAAVLAYKRYKDIVQDQEEGDKGNEERERLLNKEIAALQNFYRRIARNGIRH